MSNHIFNNFVAEVNGELLVFVVKIAYATTVTVTDKMMLEVMLL